MPDIFWICEPYYIAYLVFRKEYNIKVHGSKMLFNHKLENP
jgi:hypothetical protein